MRFFQRPKPWNLIQTSYLRYQASLSANGYAMSDLVKCTVLLADMSEWQTFNGIYKTYFSDRYPARSAIGANGLALGAKVEVECIAAVD
ncbi:RidA family protein [Enterovibrio norvegicus]|uniref:RidA family protein n=1 Tax=Enterovibrio norvegicus TaxID=188144 RepID=UPI002467ADAF|nr:Rid family hydrolase [Enterovibrio norvegicus]